MAKNDNLHDFLVDVADAIREKKGTTDLINPQNFSEEILSIEGGGGTELIDALVDKTITEYENDTATKVSQYLFYECESLKKISFTKATVVENMALSYCTSLTEVNLPLVESIGSQSIRMSSVSILDFPKLNTIGYLSLNYNTKLETLILRNSEVCNLSNISDIGNTPIANGTGYIYVPADLVDAYKSATNWSTYADQIKSLDELPA